jgi:hypothetical protein
MAPRAYLRGGGECCGRPSSRVKRATNLGAKLIFWLKYVHLTTSTVTDFDQWVSKENQRIPIPIRHLHTVAVCDWWFSGLEFVDFVTMPNRTQITLGQVCIKPLSHFGSSSPFFGSDHTKHLTCKFLVLQGPPIWILCFHLNL